MAQQESGIAIRKNAKGSERARKRSRQGSGIGSKFATHKTSKLYKKKYHGQGRAC